MLYITIIDYYIHAKSQMILQFFHIRQKRKKKLKMLSLILTQEIEQIILFMISIEI